jgi:hypothetical protein
MLTQTAIRSDAFHRSVPPTRNVALAATKVFDGASERKPLGQSIYLMGAAMSYPRNAEIYGENELAEYLYKMISGAVRTYKILSDGRRQIGGFYLPGDIFGLEFADEHTLSAEGNRRREGAGDQAQHAHRARCPRYRSCRRAFCAYWVRGAAYARARPAAHQDRAPVRPMPLFRDTR